jgi:hypothetical protein
LLLTISTAPKREFAGELGGENYIGSTSEEVNLKPYLSRIATL